MGILYAMPKVSPEYRRARRDEIAAAALRCLERDGVAGTSIADIVAESGLSAGAIYSHFTNKAEIARYLGREFLIVKLDQLEAEAAAGLALSPREVITQMLTIAHRDGVPAVVVLQFWTEAQVDDELRPTFLATVEDLRASLQAILLPWARTVAVVPDGDSETDSTGKPDHEAAAQRRASEAAASVLAVAQGYILHVALFGPRDPGDYLASISAALS